MPATSPLRFEDDAGRFVKLAILYFVSRQKFRFQVSERSGFVCPTSTDAIVDKVG